MSRGRATQSTRIVSEDIWTKLGREPIIDNQSSESLDCTTLLVGDSGSGKSSIWQSFLKPTLTKEPKPTFALEYSFARKKVAVSVPGVAPAKNLAHIWELVLLLLFTLIFFAY